MQYPGSTTVSAEHIAEYKNKLVAMLTSKGIQAEEAQTAVTQL